jgi:hypothetical protein
MPHAGLFDYGQKIQTEALPKSVSALRRRSALSASPDMRWSSFYASAGGNRAGDKTEISNASSEPIHRPFERDRLAMKPLHE